MRLSLSFDENFIVGIIWNMKKLLWKIDWGVIKL